MICSVYTNLCPDCREKRQCCLIFLFRGTICLCFMLLLCSLAFRYVSSDLTQKESTQWETVSWSQNCGLHSHHCPDCCKISHWLTSRNLALSKDIFFYKTQSSSFTRLFLMTSAVQTSVIKVYTYKGELLFDLLNCLVSGLRCWSRLWWLLGLSAAGLHVTFTLHRMKWLLLCQRLVSSKDVNNIWFLRLSTSSVYSLCPFLTLTNRNEKCFTLLQVGVTMWASHVFLKYRWTLTKMFNNLKKKLSSGRNGHIILFSIHWCNSRTWDLLWLLCVS